MGKSQIPQSELHKAHLPHVKSDTLEFWIFLKLFYLIFSWANISFYLLETEGIKNKVLYFTSLLLSEYNDCAAACLGRCRDKQAMEVHISWHVSLVLLEIQ